MTEEPMTGARSEPLPDQDHRDAIESALDVNMLVEAGAGSGKTESLARRMAAGILDGVYDVEGMAAVTFTRKAAAELRGRFQRVLEQRLAKEANPDRRARAERALRHLERFFAGTIHSFCAHLLRERPVEAGLAPGFTELDDVGGLEAWQSAWREFLARERATGSTRLRALKEAGVKTSDLDDEFKKVCTYEEVEFPAGDATVPDTAPVMAAFERFWRQLEPYLPASIPHDTNCPVLTAARQSRVEYRVAQRGRPVDVVTLVDRWSGSFPITMVRWKAWYEDTRKLRDEIDALLGPLRAVIGPFLEQWRQHVYRLAIELLVDARDFARESRMRALTLSYEDLLQISARLLRDDEDVRRALQRKYRWLFVDEFQDTDPVQAEVIVWLASDASSTTWTKTTLRPGALFIVGDPKQSIFRFRRADIETYAKVREIIERSGGRVVPLEANFRSVPELCEWANDMFATVFATRPTRHQPGFHALKPVKRGGRPSPDADGAGASPAEGAARPRDVGVRTLTVPREHRNAAAVARYEADAIARYVRAEVDAGRRSPGDFLVLAWPKKRLSMYAAALEAVHVPVEVSGAGAFGDSDRVRVLAALLHALADPDDEVEVVGVLRGALFGVSDPELYAHRVAGGRFAYLGAGRSSDASASPTRVQQALATLEELHGVTRALPVAAAVERVLDRTGLLALAAADSPGGAEGGDVMHAVDRVRRVIEEGGTLADAAEALVTDTESNEVESLPLEPGRGDVVRVMNLHKAKGLEAPVVFLADPLGGWQPSVDVRIVREGGTARGYLAITRPWGKGKKVVACPAGWDAHVKAEEVFVEAEHDRLRYVAATRAEELMVVGCQASDRPSGPWASFASRLLHVPELVVPDGVTLPEPAAVDLSPDARRSAAEARERRVAAAEVESFAVESATGGERARVVVREDDGARLLRGPATGMAWGELVHKLLERAMTIGSRGESRSGGARRSGGSRGSGGSGESELAQIARALAKGNPALESVVPEAVETVERVMRSDVWREAMAADERHVEVPFTVVLEDEGVRPKVMHGAIDLAFRDRRGWTIVDYKTDQATGDGDELLAVHGAQLLAYASAWRKVVGDGMQIEVALHALRTGMTHRFDSPG